jgi:hypothetical protein
MPILNIIGLSSPLSFCHVPIFSPTFMPVSFIPRRTVAEINIGWVTLLQPDESNRAPTNIVCSLQTCHHYLPSSPRQMTICILLFLKLERMLQVRLLACPRHMLRLTARSIWHQRLWLDGESDNNVCPYSWISKIRSPDNVVHDLVCALGGIVCLAHAA